MTISRLGISCLLAALGIVAVCSKTLKYAASHVKPRPAKQTHLRHAPNRAAQVAISPAQRTALQSASLAFIRNDGQWDSHAKFLARTAGLNLWLTDEGMVMDFHKYVRQSTDRPSPTKPQGTIYGDVVRMKFVGSTPAPVSGQGLLEGRANYFIGNDRSRWASNVPRFSTASARDPYPGISVRYYFESGSPRYDLVCAPGANPAEAAFKVEGAKSMRALANGDLEIATSVGPVEEKGLVAYQDVCGTKTRVTCRMVVDGDIVRFKAGGYDKRLPLIIDPLVSSTFIGGSGSGYDTSEGLALDSAGNAVIVGIMEDATYPTTTGAYQATGYSRGSAFASKISVDGKTLLSSTALSGTGETGAVGVAIDSSNNMVLGGSTFADDFPTTSGAYQTSNHGSYTGFVSKISEDGTTLLASTYLGGNDGDSPSGIAIDKSGNFVLAGQTASADYPTTANAYQGALAGTINAFVSRVSPDCKQLVSSTYFGGEDQDYAFGVAIDGSNNAVVAGWTISTNFPTTNGAYQTTFTSSFDGFISKVSADGTQLLASTLLGGNGQTLPTAIALDSSGNPVVVSKTNSTNGPTTSGAYQTTLTGSTNLLVSKLSSSLATLISSTYLGGSNVDVPQAVVVDGSGDAIIAGWTESTDFPTTTGAYQSALAGTSNAFVSELTPDGKQLLSSTYLGGESFDQAFGVALDQSGYVVVAGSTNSSNFPVTANAYQTALPDEQASFVTRLQLVLTTVTSVVPAQPSLSGGAVGYSTIHISQPAGSLGETVNLVSSNSSVLPVASSVVVPSGDSAKDVGYRAGSVSSNTPVTITASIGSSSKVGTVTVTPPGLATFTISPTSVAGGNSVLGHVTLAANAGPTGDMVTLSSSSSALTVPATVSVPAGQNYLFPIFSTAAVNSDTDVTVTATIGSSQIPAQVTVKEAQLATFTFSPGSLQGGAGSVLAHFTLNEKAGSAGSAIGLQSNSSTVAVPTTVTVPAGQDYLFVYFATSAAAAATNVTVTATLDGVQLNPSVTVNPPAVTSITLSPSSVVGGQKVLASIHISQKAPSPGVVVTLSSNSASLQVPTTVTVPTGQDYLFVYFTTTAVAGSAPVTVTASDATSSEQGSVTLTP